MTLYLIRHGQTNYNVERRHQGMWGESRLTENGFLQAAEAAKSLAQMSPTHIYCSSSLRTRQTASVICPTREDILFRDDLREIDTGYCTNKTLEECVEEYGDAYRMTRKTRDFSELGGESTADVFKRAKNFIQEITEKCGENDEIFVISHGDFIRFLCAALLEISQDALANLPNCGCAVIKSTAYRNVLVSYGMFQQSPPEVYITA